MLKVFKGASPEVEQEVSEVSRLLDNPDTVEAEPSGVGIRFPPLLLQRFFEEISQPMCGVL